MTSKEFTNFLLKSAVCLMACDGDVHQSEIDELKTIGSESSYFDLIDFEEELEKYYTEVKEKGKDFVYAYYRELESVNIELSVDNELILLEVLLKITYADDKVDDNELIFLGMIRPRLKVSDETILDTLGAHRAGILLNETHQLELRKPTDILTDFSNMLDVSLSEAIERKNAEKRE